MLLHRCLYLKIWLHIYKIKEISELFFITIVELEFGNPSSGYIYMTNVSWVMGVI